MPITVCARAVASAAVLVLVTGEAQAADGPPNGGFESGDFSFWTVQGAGSWEVLDLAHPNREGSYYASTCDDIWPGEGGCRGGSGESDTGTLFSNAFDITQPLLSYRIAGQNGPGCERDLNFLRLLDASTHAVLRSRKAPCANQLKEESWDVSDLLGRSVYLQVEDADSSPSWAWIAVDDFRLTGEPSEAEGANPPLRVPADAGYLVRVTDGFTMMVSRADGSAEAQYAPVPWKVMHPTFSPDGSRVAFSANQYTAYSSIYVASSDGTDVRPLTADEAWDHSPTWSPDGRYIAFVTDKDSGGDIYAADLEQGDVLRLTRMGTASDPSWVRGSAELVFAADGKLFTVDVATRDVQQLTSGAPWDGYPSVSPDGSTVSFSRNDELYVMDLDAGSTRQLTFGYASVTGSAWSPGGRYLAFVSDRDGDREVYVADPASGAVQQVTFNDGIDIEPVWYPGSGPLPTAVTTTPDAVAPATDLLPPFPNPFNAETVLRFCLAARGVAEVSVHDVLGRRVITLCSGLQQAGEHTITWRGQDVRGVPVASGTYFVRLVTPDGVRVRRLALLR